MLTEYHATGAEDAGNEEDDAHPPDRIETEILGKGKESPTDSTDGCEMGGYLPPHIDEGTDNLNHQGCDDDGDDEMGYMHLHHDIDATEITENRQDVGHHATLATSEFDEAPTLIATIEVDEHRGQQDGEEIDHDEHLEFVNPWEDAHVTERKKGYQPDDGQVEWREHHTDCACCEN